MSRLTGIDESNYPLAAQHKMETLTVALETRPLAASCQILYLPLMAGDRIEHRGAS